jgi:hypothetical protein
MFRHEPEAQLRCEERSRPDPQHRGVSIHERSYVLDTGRGDEVALALGAGEVVLAGQGQRPVLVAEAAGRYWWMYEGRLYSAAEWLSRGTVADLAEGRPPVPGRRARRGGAAFGLAPPAGVMGILSDLAPLLGV